MPLPALDTYRPLYAACASIVVGHTGDVMAHTFDYSDWLPDGDTIAAADAAAQTGVTVDSCTATGTTAVVVLDLSAADDDTDYILVVRVVTQTGRISVRTVRVLVRSAVTGEMGPGAISSWIPT